MIAYRSISSGVACVGIGEKTQVPCELPLTPAKAAFNQAACLFFLQSRYIVSTKGVISSVEQSRST